MTNDTDPTEEASPEDPEGSQGRGQQFRFDVTTEIVSYDEATGQFEFLMKPDPRRYEWRDVDGEQRLYDKFDRLIFPPDVLAQFAQKMAQVPLTFEAPRIDDAAAYIAGRRAGIEAMLDTTRSGAGFMDKSDDFLEALAGDQLGFVILSVDIVGSTLLATSPQAEDYHRRMVPTFLFELSETVPLFNGHVLKYTGDGLIAYFPEPSFIRKNDLALDCALTMRGLVQEAMNPAFRDRGLPSIQIRIGLDAGDAYVEVIGSPESKRHADIVGGVVSLATKIQGRAAPNEISLGEMAVRNLHIGWRQSCEIVAVPEDWPYRDTEGALYRFYRFR